ncbi:10115_t:CDS:1 [Gigaspora rosea]|nr:10115_t:CDS:1 [Gigaspora rosea]
MCLALLFLCCYFACTVASGITELFMFDIAGQKDRNEVLMGLV